jgi:hypothetical protein
MRLLSVTCAVFAALVVLPATSSAQGRGNSGKVPPGLAKKGGLPPGQAKKIYRTDDGVVVLRDVFGAHGYTVVRTASSGDTRYVYYRLKKGTTRRAVILPGTERLAFQNVPATLLREVLARLY